MRNRAIRVVLASVLMAVSCSMLAYAEPVSEEYDVTAASPIEVIVMSEDAGAGFRLTAPSGAVYDGSNLVGLDLKSNTALARKYTLDGKEVGTWKLEFDNANNTNVAFIASSDANEYKLGKDETVADDAGSNYLYADIYASQDGDLIINAHRLRKGIEDTGEFPYQYSVVSDGKELKSGKGKGNSDITVGMRDLEGVGTGDLTITVKILDDSGEVYTQESSYYYVAKADASTAAYKEVALQGNTDGSAGSAVTEGSMSDDGNTITATDADGNVIEYKKLDGKMTGNGSDKEAQYSERNSEKEAKKAKTMRVIKIASAVVLLICLVLVLGTYRAHLMAEKERMREMLEREKASKYRDKGKDGK